MNGARGVLAWTALLIALAAIVVSAGAFRRSPGGAPAPGAHIDIWMLITGQGGIGGPATSHLYDPQMMVVRRGDTVRMRVMNQSLFSHATEIVGLGVRTKALAGGEADELTFTPTRTGIFEYRCVLPYNPATGTCSPDHDTMIGHLVVIDAPAR